MNGGDDNGTLKGVEIFAAGTRKGKPYTRAHLDEIVSNFNRFSSGDNPLVEPPVAIGHEEEQELLENTGIPQMGKPTKVWRDGDVLKADIAELPPLIKYLLKKKAYKHTSAEIYDNPPEGVPGKGKMLRRVCFLGGELPHIKSLADLPPLYEDFSEARPRATRLRISTVRPSRNRGAYMVFSEVAPMMRDELIAALTAKGMPEEVLATMDDKQLQAVYDSHQQAGEPAPEEAPAPANGAPPADAYSEDAENLTAKPPEEDEMFADVPEGDDGKDYVCDKVRKFYEYGVKKYGEDAMPMTLVDKETQPGGMAQEKPASEPTPFSEDALVEKIVARLGGSAQTLAKFSEDIAKTSIKSFLDSMVAEGRVEPWERDASGPLPSLDARLARLDGTTPVHKFGEKSLTALEVEMEVIRQRPIKRKNVRTAASGNAFDSFGETTDVVKKIERFCETNKEAVERIGFTPADLVGLAKKAKESGQTDNLNALWSELQAGA